MGLVLIMGQQICIECKRLIDPLKDERPAFGPDGVMHERCAKRMKSHGRELTDEEAAAVREEFDDDDAFDGIGR